MQPDDDLCLCFHVSWRKVINYIRVHKVRVPSRLSECQGAGTGCGWCRVFMEQLVSRIDVTQPVPEDLERWLEQQLPAAQAYAKRRANYIARGKIRSADDAKVDDAKVDDAKVDDVNVDDANVDDVEAKDVNADVDTGAQQPD